MHRYNFTIVKNLICLFILCVSSFSICVFAGSYSTDRETSLGGRHLKFADNEVTIDDLPYRLNIKVGECKGTDDGLQNFIVYIDESNFFRPQLCICNVNSCRNLPMESDWHLSCNDHVICKAISRRAYPVPFCQGILEGKDMVRFVPVEFFSQTFFNPGIRVIESRNDSIYKDEVFMSYNDFVRRNGRTEFTGDFYGLKAYMVDNNKICIENPQDPRPPKCIPIPVLTALTLSKYKYNQMKVEFIGTAPLEEYVVKDNIGFIIKPKINLDNHKFYLEENSKKKVFPVKDESIGSRIKYKRDDRVKVKCIDSVGSFNAIFGYILKTREDEYDRYIWLRPLYSRMVRYVKIKNKQYIQCADYEYDLKDKMQSFLDEIFINEDGYYFFAGEQNADIKLNMYTEDNPCNNLKNSFYLYQDHKLKLRYKKSWEFPPEVLTQYYTEHGRFDADVIRFFNADNKEELSLDVKLQNDLELLDYYSMGMCVDDFKTTIYAAKTNTSSSSSFLGNKRKITRNKDVDVWLSHPELTGVYNVPNKCDFIKVEIWGGGQSGKIDDENGESKAGEPGEYVMGMFKIKKSDQYSVKIHFDVNQNVNIDQSIGSDSIIEFCKHKKRDGKDTEICEVKLTANGGGKLSDDKVKNIISNHAVHDRNMLYYRIVDNHRNRISYNIPVYKRVRLIPYQNFVQDILFEELSGNECTSGKLLEENTSKYFGAGGCANFSTHSTEEGAGGMVKITCEDWYS
ncbi:hypothetical protein EDL79_04480 [Ehrlichia ruminantium]|uniref:Uncharacterized protein n=1 Tax=Ehrlichia ruminantium TaxID=779 RepID=A0AAE6QBL1_EHRRU|nr:hypothetical protein [Ehrlichia ruminantium]QGR02863.1 hypothetical protein EDL81_04460 [Ehrlichia ruminantium]QGR03788.1 hypothetical protein EDL80_04470 [Ehrlichia ruminantium]QGR04715.1 hypothetical protein EDL79_04480 [Ehrlichia ruminantium]